MDETRHHEGRARETLIDDLEGEQKSIPSPPATAPLARHSDTDATAQTDVRANEAAETELPTRADHSDLRTASQPAASRFRLQRGDQLFVAVAFGVMLLLMLVHWVRLSGWGMKPVEIRRDESLPYEFRIEINSATWVEWSQLEGLGQTLAQRIVNDREQNGPFKSIEDVERVRGIGPKTLEHLRPWLTIDSQPD